MNRQQFVFWSWCSFYYSPKRIKVGLLKLTVAFHWSRTVPLNYQLDEIPTFDNANIDYNQERRVVILCDRVFCSPVSHSCPFAADGSVWQPWRERCWGQPENIVECCTWRGSRASQSISCCILSSALAPSCPRWGISPSWWDSLAAPKTSVTWSVCVAKFDRKCLFITSLKTSGSTIWLPSYCFIKMCKIKVS